MCREVCSSIVPVNRRCQIVETAVNPVERDEARFAGRRKYSYNRGRFLNRDERAVSTDSELSWYRAVFIFFSIFFIYFIIYFYLSILSIYSIFLSILNYRGRFLGRS